MFHILEKLRSLPNPLLGICAGPLVGFGIAHLPLPFFLNLTLAAVVAAACFYLPNLTSKEK